MSRLAESYKNDKNRLRDIASADVLANLQRILVTSPPTVSSNTFVTVLHVLVIMASHGSDVGPMLLEENIGATLRQLLVGTGTGSAVASSPSAKASTSAGASASDDLNHSRNSNDGGFDIELVQRNPQELYEITSLVSTVVELPQHK